VTLRRNKFQRNEFKKAMTRMINEIKEQTHKEPNEFKEDINQ
jgi:hypothetical protein